MAEEDWKRNYKNIYNNLKNNFSSNFVDIDDIGKTLIRVREVKRLSPKHLILAYLIVSDEGITSFPLETDLMEDGKMYGGIKLEEWLNSLFNVEDDKRLSFFHKLRLLAYIHRIISSLYTEAGGEEFVEVADYDEEEIEIEEEEYIYEEEDEGLDEAEIIEEDEEY